MDDEEEGIQADWLNDPHTKRLLRDAVKRKEAALSAVLSAASQTDDPSVIRPKVRYDELCARVKVFESGLSTPKRSKA